MADLRSIFDTTPPEPPFPDGVYHVTSSLNDPGFYIRIIKGKQQPCTKEEFEAEQECPAKMQGGLPKDFIIPTVGKYEKHD